MTEFTPLQALLGGGILGFAAFFLLWMNGKVSGVSGIVSRAIKLPAKDNLWRWMFIVGLIIGPMITSFFGKGLPQSIDVSWTLIIIGGLLVGMGSSLGSGCTSGHGICGIGRASPRSITATAVFMCVALITVFVLRHIGA